MLIVLEKLHYVFCRISRENYQYAVYYRNLRISEFPTRYCDEIVSKFQPADTDAKVTIVTIVNSKRDNFVFTICFYLHKIGVRLNDG